MEQDDKIKMMAPPKNMKKSSNPFGGDKCLGLSIEEKDEYLHYLSCNIGDITPKGWQRLCELSRKHIDALIGCGRC